MAELVPQPPPHSADCFTSSRGPRGSAFVSWFNPGDVKTSPGLEGYWVNDNAPLFGPAHPATVRSVADAQCTVSPASSPVAVLQPPAPPDRPLSVDRLIWLPGSAHTVVFLCVSCSAPWWLSTQEFLVPVSWGSLGPITTSQLAHIL